MSDSKQLLIGLKFPQDYEENSNISTSDVEDAIEIFEALRDRWRDEIMFNKQVLDRGGYCNLVISDVSGDSSNPDSVYHIYSPFELDSVESYIYSMSDLEPRSSFSERQKRSIVEEVIEELENKGGNGGEGQSVDSSSVDELMDEAGLDDPPEF